MAYAIWPTDIPDPETNITTTDVVNHLQDEINNRGRPTARRIFTDNPFLVQISLILTTTQFTSFHTFFHSTLNNGAAFFNAPWLNDLELTYHSAKFTGTYSISMLGSEGMELQSNIEVLPQVRLSGNTPIPWFNG